MKLVFLSNFMNHHQLPVARCLVDRLGREYCFVALEPVPESRRQMGYADLNRLEFVHRAYESPEAMTEAEHLIACCDILVAGSCPDRYVAQRLREGKLTVKISERYFKEGGGLKNRLRQYLRAKKHLAPLENKGLHFLCASAYTAADINRHTHFDSCYRWGYFPEIKPQTVETLFAEKAEQGQVQLLWAGRMLSWKHPEVAVLTAVALKQRDIPFHLTLVGQGPEEERVKTLTRRRGLEKEVSFLPFETPEALRRRMERSHIYLFASDQQEGWGAVLNEAMNSGCALVADGRAGSVPFLLKDEENGFVYWSLEQCIEKTVLLAESASMREAMGRAAYETMKGQWSPEMAADRLLLWLEDLCKEGRSTRYRHGPCSAIE